MLVNCSADVQAVIAHVDKSSQGRIQLLSTNLRTCSGWAVWMMMLTLVSFLFSRSGSGVFECIRLSVRKGLWSWQALQPFWLQHQVLRVLWRVGGQGWSLRSRFWVGTGACFARLGKLPQGGLLTYRQVRDTSIVVTSRRLLAAAPSPFWLSACGIFDTETYDPNNVLLSDR